MADKDRREEREATRFALILSVLLLLLSAIAAWRGHPRRAGWCAGAAAAVLVARYAALPVWLRAFALWMRFAEALGWLSTRIILALFYYLVLAPVGVAFRLFRRDALDLKFRDGRSSYWVEKEPVDPTLDRYRKPF